jgi:hypothetical protein
MVCTLVTCGVGAAAVGYFKTRKAKPTKKVEKIATTIIKFLGSWLVITMFNYQSASLCALGTKHYQNCDHLFADITCPIYYVGNFACHINKVIDYIGSFKLTLGIFFIKSAVDQIFKKKES